MAEDSNRLRLLAAIAEQHGFHTGIFLTYGADLAFFEEAVLRSLWDNGCRNILIFMDSKRYADTLTDFRRSVSWAGCRYVVRPVELGPLQSFHPKLALLAGGAYGRLMVGSGNLTFTGFGHNYEVYTCVDWTPDQPSFHALFTQVWKLITTINDRWGSSKEASVILRKAEAIAPWLPATAEESADIRLLHTLEEPLLDQLARALQGAIVDRLTIVTPFLDDEVICLQQIIERTSPKEIRLVLQQRRAVGNAQNLKRLMKTGAPLRVYKFSDDDFYLHAKLYLFETNRGAHLLSGSPNCTRAAMLCSCSDGNVEIALLRHARSNRHFERLIKRRMSGEPVKDIDEMKIERRPVSQPKHEPSRMRLLDISLCGGSVSGILSMEELPEEVGEFQLCLRAARTSWLPLGISKAGETEFTMGLPPDLLAWLKGPLSASLWGRTVDGEVIDLQCNELWVTNVDVLHHEMSRALPGDARAGIYLIKMLIESDEQWRDLYEALTRLVELDLRGLKRRGGTYTTSPPVRLPPPDQGEQSLEDRVILVSDDEEVFRRRTEIAGALYRESAVYRLIDLLRRALPGASPVIRAPGDVATETTPQGAEPRERYPPSDRLKRKFADLVRKYARSLMNSDYMQSASIYHILGYYSLFQRIIVLLREHEAISSEGFVQFAADINAGFFGSPGDNPPPLVPRLRRQFQQALAAEWVEHGVPAYALGSAVASALTPGGQQLEDTVELGGLAMRVMAGLAMVVDLPLTAQDTTQLASVVPLYADEISTFQSEVRGYVRASLPEVHELLHRWFNQALAAIESTESLLDRAILYRAALDCGRGAYRIAAYQKNEEVMRRWCSDLISWAKHARDRDITLEWHHNLVGILLESDQPRDAAEALLRQATELFYRQRYQESTDKLFQARLLAERLGDEELVKRCQQVARWSQFFLVSKRSK